ncbi:M20/M25/M40 family metallo-hydrolase [Orrella sp. JC864]|uniref:M20 family metallopeptidase n=1 Tax=Orrella sp. JC864 TaxID=3120298 RepID=UPI00300A19B5
MSAPLHAEGERTPARTGQASRMDSAAGLARVAAAVDEQRVVQLISESARIKSYSGDERQIADYMQARLADLGLQVERQEVSPNRYNVVGRWPGSGGGKSLMFNGHMDTNPAGMGWTKDPLGGVVEDGHIFGIGVSNMKAANGSFLHAMEALKACGYQPKGDIVLAYVVGELQGGVGTCKLIETGIRTDYFIVGEPTDLCLLTCHAASFVFRIHVHGKTRHLSKMEEGVDAIAGAMKIAAQLRELKFSGAPTQESQDLSRINIGVIRGGMTAEYFEWRPQQLADVCTLKCAGRFGYGQTQDGAMADIRALLDRIERDTPGLKAELELFEDNRIFMPPFKVGEDAPPVIALQEAAADVLGHVPATGAIAPYKFLGSDAAHLAQAGMTGVVMGPGGKYNTMPDERVSIVDIVAAAKIYAMATAQLTQGTFK